MPRAGEPEVQDASPGGRPRRVGTSPLSVLLQDGPLLTAVPSPELGGDRLAWGSRWH